MSHLVPHHPTEDRPKTYEEWTLPEKQSILFEMETAFQNSAQRGIKLGKDAIELAKKLAADISEKTGVERVADVR